MGEFPDDSVVRTPALSLPWAQVQSLVGELKSHKLHGTAKKKKQWVLWRPVVLKECWWIQEPRVRLTLGVWRMLFTVGSTE